MFKGSIPSTLRRIVREVVDGWGVDALNVGCSGNFTIERSLADKEIALSGNDVSLYTCAVGQYLAGEDHPITVKPEWADRYGWLEEFLVRPVDRAATIILSSDLLNGPLKENPDEELAYFVAQREGYRRQWPRLHASTVEKLEALPRLARFYTGDLGEFVDSIGDGPFASFPPFWAKGYEKMFANLAAVFEWEEPDFPTLDPERIAALTERMADREHWCLGLLERSETLEENYTARSLTDLGGLTIHVYASAGHKRTVVPRRPTAPAPLPCLTTGDRLTGDLGFMPLTVQQFEGLRVRHLNAAIWAATPTRAWALVDSGRIVGCFALGEGNSAQVAGGAVLQPSIYLLSDFSVAPTDYPRLSKLVLYALCSKEAQVMLERAQNRRVRGLVTTVFSQNPVSGKYRGVFRLSKRVEEKDDSKAHRFKLTYGAPCGQWSLAEAWGTWNLKHGGMK